MNDIVIVGGRRLDGKVRVQGAKNAVLPILAATVLNGGENVIHDCPELMDVQSSIEILKCLGCKVKREKNVVIVDSSGINSHYIPDYLMREMRSSIIFLGAVVARCKKAVISTPGGCELGPRPIDLHIKAFRELGIEIEESGGFLNCEGEGFRPTQVHLNFPSVGATENIMLLAAIGKGTTTITNAAREPEIIDLESYLNAMGAKISGAGTEVITIEGVKKLTRGEHTVIADRIVAATYLCAGLMCGGRVTAENARAEHLQSVISVLKDCGAALRAQDEAITLSAPSRIRAVDMLKTQPYPGFPTDAQAFVSTALSIADGTSIIVENIFENRFKHCGELRRMGADISVSGRVAVIRGVHGLSGANLSAADLRGGAALALAGLAAEGETRIANTYHIDRGYEKFTDCLSRLGAQIRRI